MAAFELAYAIELPAFPMPAIDAVFTIQPFEAFSALAAFLEHLNGPITFVCSIECHRSSVIASKSSKGIGSTVAAVPALLTKISNPPSLSIALKTIASALSGSDTSPGAAID
jgi:hypothetical protein